MALGLWERSSVGERTETWPVSGSTRPDAFVLENEHAKNPQPGATQFRTPMSHLMEMIYPTQVSEGINSSKSPDTSSFSRSSDFLDTAMAHWTTSKKGSLIGCASRTKRLD